MDGEKKYTDTFIKREGKDPLWLVSDRDGEGD